MVGVVAKRHYHAVIILGDTGGRWAMEAFSSQSKINGWE